MIMQKRRKNICFIHVYRNNAYLKLLKILIEEINASHLKENTDKIILNFTNEGTIPLEAKEGFIVKEELGEFEYPTLKLIRDFSEKEEGFNVMYFHLKGTGSEENTDGFKKRFEWFKYALWFCVKNHIEFINKINDGKYNVIGLDYRADNPHFSGNFWWAKSEYLKTLPLINESYINSPHPVSRRHGAEFWISKGKDFKPFCMYDANTNWYMNNHPANKYINFFKKRK